MEISGEALKEGNTEYSLISCFSIIAESVIDSTFGLYLVVRGTLVSVTAHLVLASSKSFIALTKFTVLLQCMGHLVVS